MAGGIVAARDAFQSALISSRVLALRDGVPTNADRDSDASRAIAELMAAELCARFGLPGLPSPGVPGGTQGKLFADLTKQFLETTLPSMPRAAGRWTLKSGGSIDLYAQYAHLREVQAAVQANPELRVSLGGDYIIGPDVVLSRTPLDDAEFGPALAAGDAAAQTTSLRSANAPLLPIMHASVSCKWTLRSDRAQNARTEALNLIRNRKGRAPAIAVVTAEPLPSRLASLAEGTGDVDRVYHFALYELLRAVASAVSRNARLEPQLGQLEAMVKGRRLADVSDLPFDLVA